MTQRYALTISDFCESHAISKTQFYKLLKNGRGPQLMKLGKRRLISIEAAEEWRNKLTNQSVIK